MSNGPEWEEKFILTSSTGKKLLTNAKHIHEDCPSDVEGNKYAFFQDSKTGKSVHEHVIDRQVLPQPEPAP